MMHYLLAQVLVQTYLDQVGKFNTEKALKVSFGTTVDHAKEEGYRHLDLVIYGPMNYVGVYIRTRWNVIPLEDLEDDGDGDTFVKEGKDYVLGGTAWEQICYHDSGWRSAIQDLLFKMRDTLSGFEGSSFYEVIDVPEELRSKG